MTFDSLPLGIVVNADGLTDRFDGDEDVVAFVGDGGNSDAVDDRDCLLFQFF